MIRIAKKLGIIFLISFMNINSFAKEINTVYNGPYNDCNDSCDMNETHNDPVDYFQKGNDLSFKLRASYLFPQNKATVISSTSKSLTTTGRFSREGLGVDAAIALYFCDKISAELSLGYYGFRVKNAYLTSVIQNFNNVQAPKSKWLYLVPISVLGQYHFMPYGGIDPYVGIGINGAYATTGRTRAFKAKGGFGPVFQLGANFYAKDDTFYIFEIKKLFTKTTIRYRKDLVANNDVRTRLKLNPWAISVGIGYKF